MLINNERLIKPLRTVILHGKSGKQKRSGKTKNILSSGKRYKNGYQKH
jgi:hypothetical protein